MLIIIMKYKLSSGYRMAWLFSRGGEKKEARVKEGIGTGGGDPGYLILNICNANVLP